MTAESEALRTGTPIEALTATRDLLANAMIAAEPKELSPLSREYRAVLAELERRGAGREGSVLDDLAARRTRRRGA